MICDERVIDNYSDMTISRGIANLGVSGISVSSMTFKTAYHMEYIGQAAETVLSNVSNIPTYYVNKREYNDGVWSVECLDRCAFLDQPIDTEHWTKTADNKYNISALEVGLRDVIGFGSVEFPQYMPTYIPCDMVDGQTYQSVLSSIATAFCGFFCSYSTNTLSFIRYDNSGVSATVFEDYSTIHDAGQFNFSPIAVTNGNVSQTFSQSGSVSTGLNINSPLADLENVNIELLYSTLSSLYWQGWSCDNAVCTVGYLPMLGGRVTFSDGQSTVLKRVTNMTARIIGDVAIVSASQEIPQMGEIQRRGLLQQRLDETISSMKVYKNVKVTPTGAKAVPDKDNEKPRPTPQS